MSDTFDLTQKKRPASFGRLVPVLLALLATGGLIYWFAKPKPDIRYARSATIILSQIEPGGDVKAKLERGAEVSVILAKDLNGWAMVLVGISSTCCAAGLGSSRKEMAFCNALAL